MVSVLSIFIYEIEIKYIRFCRSNQKVRVIIMLKVGALVILNYGLSFAITSELVSPIEDVALIDWIQVVIDLFVTFFGFGLAMLGERLTNWLKIRSDTKMLEKLVKEELKKILCDLENFDLETLDVQPLKIPLWESAISTGQVSLFDFTTRNKLFLVYNAINEFNSWCLVHTNYYFEKGQKNKLLIKELNQIKKKLLGIDSNESDLSINSAIEILERGINNGN